LYVLIAGLVQPRNARAIVIEHEVTAAKQLIDAEPG
jgi:hypothetical protein